MNDKSDNILIDVINRLGGGKPSRPHEAESRPSLQCFLVAKTRGRLQLYKLWVNRLVETSALPWFLATEPIVPNLRLPMGVQIIAGATGAGLRVVTKWGTRFVMLVRPAAKTTTYRQF